MFLLLGALNWQSKDIYARILPPASMCTQLCLILCDPTDCSPPGSSLLGILQARILEWVTIPFSRGSSWPRNWTQVSCIAGWFSTLWATWEALFLRVVSILRSVYNVPDIECFTWVIWFNLHSHYIRLILYLYSNTIQATLSHKQHYPGAKHPLLIEHISLTLPQKCLEGSISATSIILFS